MRCCAGSEVVSRSDDRFLFLPAPPVDPDALGPEGWPRLAAAAGGVEGIGSSSRHGCNKVVIMRRYHRIDSDAYMTGAFLDRFGLRFV